LRVVERLRGRHDPQRLALAERRSTMSHPKQVRLAGSVLDRKRHVCAFFHSKEEEYNVLLPFIKEGFEQGDRAFHIIDGHRRQDHMRRLQETGIDTAAAESEERLVVRHWEDAYLQDGHFDQHRQISLFERVLLEGKKQGYPLTRFVAGTEWALLDRPGVHDLIEYESRINDMFGKYDDPVCCTYDVSKFSASVIMDAMRVHPAVIIGGNYQENPFYVPPAEFLRELRERVGETSAVVA
jgi:MEDS: MEthanogen/methylotroph, DcmR Sensory domain